MADAAFRQVQGLHAGRLLAPGLDAGPRLVEQQRDHDAQRHEHGEYGEQGRAPLAESGGAQGSLLQLEFELAGPVPQDHLVGLDGQYLGRIHRVADLHDLLAAGSCW